MHITVMFFIALILYYLLRKLKKNYLFINIYASNITIYIFIIVFVIALVTNPKQSFDAALNGINLCIGIVFPSLFPFFVATELLMRLKIVNILGIILEPFIRPLFNVPGNGSLSFALGIVSGYPVGAKTVVDLRKNNLCSKIEGDRLLTFCNNSGPLFILGAVAVGVFNTPAVGGILYISHILSALTIGLVFRFYKYKHSKSNFKGIKKNILHQLKEHFNHSNKFNVKNFGSILGDAINNSVNILLLVCGFIVFFSVIINIFDNWGITNTICEYMSVFTRFFGISNESLPAIVKGFLEITTGIKYIGSIETIPLIEKLIITGIILGWGGISVHLQVMSILSKTDLSIKIYILGKFLQSLISGIYILMLLNIMSHDINTSSFFISQLEQSINYTPYMYAVASILLFIISLIIFTGICIMLYLSFFIKYIITK